MPLGLSQRLLSVFQLTRMALVFTALADSLTSVLLWADWMARGGSEGTRYVDYLSPARLLTVAVVSVGLYGYGMSLNDIIDRRRDRHIAAHRPLPSGRIGIITAHVICVMFALAALVAGASLMRFENAGMFTFVLLIFTGALITFYDYAGKYLVALGLLTLGLVRFFHATIPAPQLPLLWHPLLLMNHVTILSTVAYVWEQKRPALTRIHWWAVLGGLGLIDMVCIGLVWWRRSQRSGGNFAEALNISPGLLIPLMAVVAFVILAVLIRTRAPDIRSAGRQLMLLGLLWLIVYDASFVAGCVSLLAAVAILMLFPVAYLSILVMRWWAKFVLLTQNPEYQRAR
jgi:4-hydroxybenzoate polyprenyltransferase